MNRCALLLLFAMSFLVTASVESHPRKPEIVGHRGAPLQAPENTVASARTAWDEQADAVETDIRLTKDGEIIVSHDATTKRIDGRDTPIAERMFSELRSLDAGRLLAARSEFAGEKMATLDELIATVPAGKRLFVEIKTGPEILPALGASLVRARADSRSIVLISFDFEVLRQAHERWPQYQTLWLVRYDRSSTLEELVARARQAGLSGLDLSADWPMDAAGVGQIRTARLSLHVWTVDDSDVARHWVELGADGITTNRAGPMREELSS